ncbi:MAG: VCBS repeat-containing protein [Alphaproteobacteria bacterium]|nr:VCBS repeat-containing protein [Alphaproteobacteria bacterium]
MIGHAPPLPLSYPQWLRTQSNPNLLRQWQSGLPPVSSNPAPAPPPASPWQLATKPPNSPPLSNPLLLTDGTVIMHVSCTGTWWKLTPDNTGSYVNGSWSQIASLPSGYTPRFFSSAVLPDGRVIVEGGEYNTGCRDAWTNLGAIYDPLVDTWTAVTPPSGWSQIGDAESTVLANGTYMQSDCCDVPFNAALLNAGTLAWTTTGTGKADVYDEEGWTLLPDGTVLTVDAYVFTGSCGRNTERYNPTTGAWSSAGNTPSQLSDCANPANNPSYEMGPQVLRPDGTVIAFGGTTCSDSANTSCQNGTLAVTTHSAFFNSTNANWSAGSDIPAVSGRNYTLADAPAALLPSGNVLFAASPNYQAFAAPTHFFELSFATNTIGQVADPTDAGSFTSFQWNFLDLPTGQVLAVETDGSNVWIYTPSGTPNASWAPVIAAAPADLIAGATYTISGIQFNGLSQGAAYGDDVQTATNYPIVQITNTETGHVFDARTFNHSTMTVAPNAASATNFTMPPKSQLEYGPSTLTVIANGIPSQPVAVNLGSSEYIAPSDFNGDGYPDILWRYVDGTVAIWEMNGAQVLASVGAGAAKNDWHIVGTGDFNGDGNTDILWRNINGDVAIWLMNGGQVMQSTGFSGVTNDWQIMGTGDFDGDGKTDILWRYADGTVAIWEMNGLQVKASLGVSGSSANTDWQIIATRDFDGDGKTDILWRYKDGTIALWLMNGGQVTSSLGLGVLGSNDWQLAGVGDFDGDGKGDILWRYKDGSLAIWFTNGNQVTLSMGAGSVTTDWTVVGTADFDHDGKTDILWHRTDGTVALWLMNGSQLKSAPGVSVVSTAWNIAY